MLRKTLCLLIVCFGIQVAYACGNEYYATIELPLKDGRLNLRRVIHYGESELAYWTHGFGENIYDRRNTLAREIDKSVPYDFTRQGLTWKQMDKAFETGIDHRLLSDYAWYELRVGDKKNAVKLLEKLYEKYHSEYNVLANLGTAYEVTGNNQKALELLRKAVAINPQSHHSSEWIHLKILEQKIAGTPDYKQIIDLGAGGDFSQWMAGTRYDKPMPPDSLMVQLAYQLHERIGFIAAPDPVVGQLILDFGDIVAMKHSRETAKEFYARAIHYDSLLTAAVKIRMDTTIKQVEVEQVTATKRSSSLNSLYIAAAAMLLVATLYFVFRTKGQPVTATSDNA